ncbi:hypothetical protein PIROE2DRAFT_12151, partial [Piromyces sp. E2]
NYGAEYDEDIEEEITEVIDLQEELETMYCYFHDNMEILKKVENIREPKIEQIISIVESIDNIHFQYIQRLFESSSNENNYYVDELLNDEYKIEQEIFKAKVEKEVLSSPTESSKDENFPSELNRKGSRNKENRHSFNVLKSSDKLNDDIEYSNHPKSLYVGHKKSLSDEQNGHEQSLIDIVKAITNSMYNSRNIVYLRDDGSNWSDLSKTVNDDSNNKKYDDDDDEIDNLSDYDDYDFGATSDLNLSSSKNVKDRRRSSSTKERRKSTKYEEEEIINAKETNSPNRRTTDYLNYYNINEEEEKNESEESRKELKNAFDKIINSDTHFSLSAAKGSRTIGISKAASLRRKLSNFHFVGSSSNNQ